jgi:transposase-like protein
VSKAQQDIRRKIRALEHAARSGNIRQTCRYFGIPRSLFYLWRAAYQQQGEAGLVNKKPSTLPLRQLLPYVFQKL